MCVFDLHLVTSMLGLSKTLFSCSAVTMFTVGYINDTSPVKIFPQLIFYAVS